MNNHSAREIPGTESYQEWVDLCKRLSLMARGAAGADYALTPHGVPKDSNAFAQWVAAVWMQEVSKNVSTSFDVPFDIVYVLSFTKIKSAAHTILDVLESVSVNMKHYNARKQLENVPSNWAIDGISVFPPPDEEEKND